MRNINIDCLGWIIFFTLGFYGGCMTGTIETRQEDREQAVKNGYAEWVVAEDGTTTFTWLKPTHKVQE